MNEHLQLIAEIESRGWIVKVFPMGEYVELQAVRIPSGVEVLVARCGDGDGEDAILEAATVLKEMTSDSERIRQS